MNPSSLLSSCLFTLAALSFTADITTATSYLENGEEPKLFCYYSSFAKNRKGLGKFRPEDIDPGLCTHVIFAFADLVKGSFLKPSSWNDLPNGKDKGLYARTQALKVKNPKIKVLLALGGWKIGSTPFIPMVRDTRKRKLFVRNVVRYLRKHGFDGLDMDWEFPGTRGSSPDDKYKFTALMKELRTAFERESRQTGRDRLLLTMAAAGGSYFIGLAYEPEKLAKYLDYILLMTYNYHGSWNDFTGHHSGLFPRADEAGGEREWNQAWTIDYWLNQAGAPKEKIVVGIATYGMTFTLADPKDNGLKAAAVGGGNPGPYTGESGIMSYYEICRKLASGWNSVWIDEQKVPYAYSGSQWIGYDNQDSVTYKSNYIREKGLAGAFIWSVEMDDFRGTCGEGKYPLLRTIATVLRQPRRTTSTLAGPNVMETSRSSRVVPSGLAVSRNGGIYDENNDFDDYEYGYDQEAKYSRSSNKPGQIQTYENMFMGYDEGSEQYPSDSYQQNGKKLIEDGYSYNSNYDVKDDSFLQNQNPSDAYDVSSEHDSYADNEKYIEDDLVTETGHSLVSSAALDPVTSRTVMQRQQNLPNLPRGRERSPNTRPRLRNNVKPETRSPDIAFRERNYDTRRKDRHTALRSATDNYQYTQNMNANQRYEENTQSSAYTPRLPEPIARETNNRNRLYRPIATTEDRIPPTREIRQPYAYDEQYDDRYGRPDESQATNRRKTHLPAKGKVETTVDPDKMDFVYGQAVLPRDREQLKSMLKDVDNSYINRLLSGPHSQNIVGLESQRYDSRPQQGQLRVAGGAPSKRAPVETGTTPRRRQYFKEGENIVEEPDIVPRKMYTPNRDSDLRFEIQDNGQFQAEPDEDHAPNHYSHGNDIGPFHGDGSQYKNLDVLQSWQYYTPGSTCTDAGLFPHQTSCKQYYICVRHESRWYKFHLTCPRGLGFKPDRAVCDMVHDCQEE